MATWITHLQVAENMLGLIPGLVEDKFAIGNVAPDSGIPDEKWEKLTPPSEVTHFRAPKEAPYPLADLEFYRQNLASLPLQQDNTKRISFLLGYFFHLVTDNLFTAVKMRTHWNA
jgi:hypothetical protein